MPSVSRMKSQVHAARHHVQNAKSQKSKVKRDIKAAEMKAQSAARRLAARRSVTYTGAERRYLESVRGRVQRQAEAHPDRRDVFLCHAWDDRAGAAEELHDYLEQYGVTVWFSEKDIPLGTSLTREIDKGLRKSHLGIVLVTPAMLQSLAAQGIADKELSALLATERVVPVVHEVGFDELREESPLLASRSGLSTQGSSLEDVAIKIANAIYPMRE